MVKMYFTPFELLNSTKILSDFKKCVNCLLLLLNLLSWPLINTYVNMFSPFVLKKISNKRLTRMNDMSFLVQKKIFHINKKCQKTLNMIWILKSVRIRKNKSVKIMKKYLFIFLSFKKLLFIISKYLFWKKDILHILYSPQLTRFFLVR